MVTTRRSFLKTATAVGVAGLCGVPLSAETLIEKSMARWNWRLRIDGEVAQPNLLGVEDCFRHLPSRLLTLPLTDEAGRVRFDQWQGAHFSTLVNLVEPSPEAKFVHVHCAEGHRDCFALGDLMRPRAILAHSVNGHLLDPTEGGPLRLVVPWRGLERSCIAVNRIEFHTEPLEGVDPLAGALPEGEPLNPTGGQGDLLPATQPGLAALGQWEVILNPGMPLMATDLPQVFQQLNHPTFDVGNAARTSLVALGVPALAAMRDAGEDSPLDSEIELTQIHAANVLAEVNDPLAATLCLDLLQDQSAEVMALALDTCSRLGEEQALSRALELVSHPHEGLALTALVAVERLGGPAQRDQVEAAQARGSILRAEALRILKRWS